MKILKKLVVVFAAASVALGTFSVLSHAEDLYNVHVDTPDASVGETVNVKIVIDAGSEGVGGISFMLNYDPTELELVSAKPGNEIIGWITGDVDENGNNSFNLDVPGKIGFAYVTMGNGILDKSADLIIASFKVLKPNAEFTLTDVDVTADDWDGTELIGDSEGATIKCSHKNSDILTNPATCTQKGSKTFTCKDCGETRTEEIPASGHDWGEWTVTKEATADEEGEETRECKNCGENETRAIAKLPAESTVTSYSGDGFHVPETTVTSTTPAESQTVTIADTTTSAAVITQNPETTTTAVTAAATKPVDNTTSTSIGNVNTDTPNNENNNVGNTDSGNSDDKNSDTGMMLAVVPAVAAAVGVIMFKKKK